MSGLAQIVGYAVLVSIAGVFVAALALFLIVHFPLRFQCTIKPPSYIKTPNQIQNIDALIGLSNRGGGKMWFIGLLTVSPGQEPSVRQHKASPKHHT